MMTRVALAVNIIIAIPVVSGFVLAAAFAPEAALSNVACGFFIGVAFAWGFYRWVTD
jgi:hypothetical protein